MKAIVTDIFYAIAGLLVPVARLLPTLLVLFGFILLYIGAFFLAWSVLWRLL